MSISLATKGILSPVANTIAGDVWDYVIEDGLKAKEILRVLMAVAAGETTITDLGGGLATVAFRDQSDIKDRVVASMTESERTSVTLDPS